MIENRAFVDFHLSEFILFTRGLTLKEPSLPIYPATRRKYVATKRHFAVSVPSDSHPDKLAVLPERHALWQHRKQPLPDWLGYDNLFLHEYKGLEYPISLQRGEGSWRRCVAPPGLSLPVCTAHIPVSKPFFFCFQILHFPC